MGRAQTSETRRKISQALKGRLRPGHGFKKGFDSRRKVFSNEDRVRAANKLIQRARERRNALPFEQLSTKRLRRSRIRDEQEGKCLLCGISEWLGQWIVLELDHINGNGADDSRENLRLLCPNCHSQTSTWKGRNIKRAGLAKW